MRVVCHVVLIIVYFYIFFLFIEVSVEVPTPPPEIDSRRARPRPGVRALARQAAGCAGKGCGWILGRSKYIKNSGFCSGILSKHVAIFIEVVSFLKVRSNYDNNSIRIVWIWNTSEKKIFTKIGIFILSFPRVPIARSGILKTRRAVRRIFLYKFPRRFSKSLRLTNIIEQ